MKAQLSKAPAVAPTNSPVAAANKSVGKNAPDPDILFDENDRNLLLRTVIDPEALPPLLAQFPDQGGGCKAENHS